MKKRLVLIHGLMSAWGLRSEVDLMNRLQGDGLVADEAVTIEDIATDELKRLAARIAY